MSALHFMYGVGIVEILAGVLVLAVPRVAPYVVAGWLAGIVTDLVIKSVAVGGHSRVFYDIALRDFGLMLAALAPGRLAAAFAAVRRRPDSRATLVPCGSVTLLPCDRVIFRASCPNFWPTASSSTIRSTSVGRPVSWANVN